MLIIRHSESFGVSALNIKFATYKALRLIVPSSAKSSSPRGGITGEITTYPLVDCCYKMQAKRMCFITLFSSGYLAVEVRQSKGPM